LELVIEVNQGERGKRLGHGPKRFKASRGYWP